MTRPRLLLTLLILLLLASACQPALPPPAWTVEDLLLLDPLDAPAARVEILALYARLRGSDLQVRLDLLDLPVVQNFDLLFVLLTPEDEITVRIPARGRKTVTSSNPALRARVVRDPYLDTVVLHFNRSLVEQPFTLQVFTSFPGQSARADQTEAVRSDALPPTARANLLLAFWDTFPAFTPAQALRRWDGAHTGPVGGRHGLAHLLAAAQRYDLPIALLDLKTPFSLAPLGTIPGALEQVRQMAEQGLLILPEAAFSQPQAEALAASRQAALDFGLPGSPFAYAPAGHLQPGYAFQFMPLPDDSRLLVDAGVRLLPVSLAAPGQVTADGLSLDVRRQLLAAAFSTQPGALVILGGSLPASTWGAADSARPAFAWLAAHPWIRVLDGYDLQTFPAAASEAAPAPAPAVQDAWLDALRLAPDNAPTRSAWMTWLMLHLPGADPALQSLRALHAGQVGTLLAAADWAQQPYSLADCSRDPDRDGMPECLLASPSVLAVIELDGARLTHLFIHQAGGVVQLVAPSSQFTVGLSDASEWRLDRGDAADPGAWMGIRDSSATFEDYAYSITGDVLTLTGAGRSKEFRLTGSGVEIRYHSPEPLSVDIPLVADALAFLTRPVGFQPLSAPGGFTWGEPGSLQVDLRATLDLAARSFSDSQAFLHLPEDPDQDYPPGHYLPYPLALVSVSGQGAFTLWIEGK